MKLPSLPPQILRLVLLVLGIVGSYGVARYFLKPASFGVHGHYRADALKELAKPDTVFAGAKSCAKCHDEVFELRDAHEHRTIACEACHGPSKAHAKDPDVATTKVDEAKCLRCHEREAARPAAQAQIVSATHYEGKCLECHLPHHPKESPP